MSQKKIKRMRKVQRLENRFFDMSGEGSEFGSEILEGNESGLMSAINSGCLVMISDEDLKKIKEGRF